MNSELDFKRIERISKALGDPYRLKIMELVNNQNEWMPCCMLIEAIGLAQSTISHHVKQLVDADLLIAEKDGRNARYFVNKKVFSDYIDFLNNFKN